MTLAITGTILCILAASFTFAQSPAPAFGIASVKSTVPRQPVVECSFCQGAGLAMNVLLKYLIQQIYAVRDFQIAGEPRWLSVIADGCSARYKIQAKGDSSSTETQVREIVKALLADRFQLRFHKETRDLPVYALIPGKAGIRLPLAKLRTTANLRGAGGIAFMVDGWIQGSNVAVPSLVQVLSGLVDRPVVDKTNFTEAFDFKLTFTSDGVTAGEPGTSLNGSCPASFLAFSNCAG
jgi:uncharacterized protein (TIGR03435 family)